jgi:hypothetical protein
VTSLLSYWFLSCVLTGDSSSSQESILFWVGILLIISAGSFIYVATVHILPEVLTPGEATGQEHHHHGHGNFLANKHEKGEVAPGNDSLQYSKAMQIAAMVVGLVAPLGLTFLEDA